MAEWLTPEELALYLKRGQSTLYKMARERRIPARKIGRSWRFDGEEVDPSLGQQTSSRYNPPSKLQRRQMPTVGNRSGLDVYFHRGATP
jgi:excisionase family DNA binding protein